MSSDQAGNFAALLNSLTETAMVQIVLIVAGAWLGIILTQHFLPIMAGKLSGRNRLHLLASVPLLRLCVIATAILLILQRVIEPTLENLIGLLGALGLAVGFASKDYVSSLIAGIVASYEIPYRPGDWIEVDGTYGEVRAIRLRTVEIVTPDDTVAYIPHLQIWNQAVLNANDGSQYLLCVADFYLHPCHNAVSVLQVLRDVALTSPFLQIERPINVIVLEKPFATHYRLKAYPIDPRQQFHFMTDLTVRGKAALLEIGVEFAAIPAVANPVG
ncbi:MAG: mechanosensitive ion channel [Gammaproteobacteria bacterium]|nr:mechanosensitive ion channel [Gammaproteobacteria bacterium]MCP5195381.1 mechanosensitive ion channel [Gammaproteobacteria bacterium]